jgi:hypothetical protein
MSRHRRGSRFKAADAADWRFSIFSHGMMHDPAPGDQDVVSLGGETPT